MRSTVEGPCDLQRLRLRTSSARTIGLHSDWHQRVASLVVIPPTDVQTVCPERAALLAQRMLAGGPAPRSGAPPGRRGPEHQRGLEAEGKIEGTGTRPVRKRVCTWGWRGTLWCTAPCRERRQCLASVGEIACMTPSDAMGLDGIAHE
jgi:hypothetical protein